MLADTVKVDRNDLSETGATNRDHDHEHAMDTYQVEDKYNVLGEYQT